MVNQILRTIDKKAAGEIRNAIAREPNKLQALQRELARRNIKVGESLAEVFDIFGPVGNLEMAVTLLAVLSMPLAIIGPEVFDRIKNKIQKMSSRRIINLLSQKQIKADTATKKMIERLLYELQQSFDRNDGDNAKQIALRIKQIAKDTEDKKSVAADPIDKFKVGESLEEAPIEMDPADPMDPMIYGHDKANPGKLKYRMARAAGQLKDLAARVDGATPEQWQRMAQQFEELKMNMEQIRHALEELGKVRKKGGIRSRGIEL